MTNSSAALRPRKGAWDAKEDILLRKCIDKHGEGKWHQVPQKAGLNRCRKSCRLRRLNYFRPNIKRGDFTSDEVDLMIRLHKLLGNRQMVTDCWTLPGRTANYVKNYWNSHLQKKLAAAAPVQKLEAKKEDLNKTKSGACICTCNVIKPLPWTSSKTTTNCFSTRINIADQSAGQYNSNNNNDNICNNVFMIKPPPPPLANDWWKNLFVEIGIHEHKRSVSVSLGGGEIEQEEAVLGLKTDESSLATIPGAEELGQNGWLDIWNLLNAD